jgi:hypothetical protein
VSIACGSEQWRLTVVVCRSIANNETHVVQLQVVFTLRVELHALIRLLRCVQIATPSVPYFRSFAITDPTRTNWPLHFYIYRFLVLIWEYVPVWEFLFKMFVEVKFV